MIVDDGIATGSTITVALRALRKAGAAKVVLAVPVAPADTISRLRREADDVVCLFTPPYFGSVGEHYAKFGQTTDQEVIDLLDATAPADHHIS